MLVLSDLVEKSEDERYPIPAVCEVLILRYLIESMEGARAKVAVESGILGLFIPG